MAGRTTSESLQRYKDANKSIETCADFLHNPDVIGTGSKLAQRAIEILDLMYVPNLIDGVYDISSGERGVNGIPYIPTVPGEIIQIKCNPERSIHPEQWSGIRRSLNEIDHEGVTDDNFEQLQQWLAEGYSAINQDGVFMMPDIEPTCWGYVWSPSTAIGVSRSPNRPSKDYGVETRPIIIGNTNELAEDHGNRMYHEVIHVAQSLRGQVYRASKKVMEQDRRRAEVEAYSGQAIAEEAFFGFVAEDNPEGWKSMAVETIRRYVNADNDDPYRVTKKFIRLVESVGTKL